MTLKEILSGKVAVRCNLFEEHKKCEKLILQNKLHFQEWVNTYKEPIGVFIVLSKHKCSKKYHLEDFNTGGYKIITFEELKRRLRE